MKTSVEMGCWITAPFARWTETQDNRAVSLIGFSRVASSTVILFSLEEQVVKRSTTSQVSCTCSACNAVILSYLCSTRSL
jgi:hypothetical protein